MKQCTLSQSFDYGIQANYIIPQNYAATAQYAKRRNILYDNQLEIFQKIFGVYREFYDETQQLFKAKNHEKSIYVQQLKNFLRKFAEIMRETSVYQVDCLTQKRLNRQQVIARVTSQILPKIDTYSKTQKNFKAKMSDLITRKQQVSKQYFNLKNQASDPSIFYNSKHMKGKAKSISDQLGDISQLEKQLNTGKQEVSSNAQEFQSYLLNFRKKLLQNKYNMLNKMNEQSKNLRGCLTEILLLLIECVNSRSEVFNSLLKNPKDDTITISQSKGRKKGEDIDSLINSLVNSIQEYYFIIDQILFILKGLDQAFKRVNSKVQQILEANKKYFMDNLNAAYTIDETPSPEVSDVLDLYEYYTTKVVGISDKLYQCSNKLNMLKQNVKKHADVTISLIRAAKKGKQDGKLPQLDQVYNQISYDFVTEVLCQVYKAFKDSLIDLKSYFNEKYYKKKKNKVEDSMEISHIDETMIVQKKKPCKWELWLWRDWRDKTYFSPHNAEVNIKQIDQFISSIKFEEDSKEIGKYECTFMGKKDSKGMLKLCEKSIQFISLIGTSNLHLCISYNDISAADIKVRTFQKYIGIQTQKGELGFKLLDNQSVLNQIKQCVEKAQKESGPKVVKKQAVVLLPEQLEYLQKNKAKILEQRPSSEGMIKIKSIFVDNVTVDQVYEYIYSDKQFTLRGKPELTFFAYTNKKAKNFNYKSSPYDKPGPEFYTQDPAVKFTNCPPYSTRVIQLDHPMPALPIPFMPKSCHCKETCNLYWIDHENFDYYVVSQSSQAPYSDTFVVKILHTIAKEGNGVKIEMQGGLYFVKDPSFKSILKSKGESEMVELATFTMSQIQTTLNLVAGNTVEAVKQVVQETPTENKSEEKPNTEVNKLKSQNKLLIIALVVVFLINILLRFVIS